MIETACVRYDADTSMWHRMVRLTDGAERRDTRMVYGGYPDDLDARDALRQLVGDEQWGAGRWIVEDIFHVGATWERHHSRAVP